MCYCMPHEIMDLITYTCPKFYQAVFRVSLVFPIEIWGALSVGEVVAYRNSSEIGLH